MTVAAVRPALPADFMWPMWSIFDSTPDGRGKDWGPELKYR
ncbi:MAG TPA: hypothetical protein VMW11_09505 [Candidatus Dormibacteraeota bacterium]|nr:hypothetical protein [Candidatus Dormibacteraeota bacterium]